MQAMSIPSNTIKTCCDAWNGYHSVPLHEESRKYTIFLTPWGRYWYLVAPQGHNCAGDGYTHQYHLITEYIPRVKRVIDDACLWDWKMGPHFYHIVHFLTLTSQHGIVQNPTKFEFGRTNIDFVGFSLGPNGVTPSAEILDAIMKFPKPTNLTGVRSLFGLIEQVSWGFSKAEVMAPFRQLLSGKGEFV